MLARDAIEAYYTGVSRDVLLKESQLEDLRKMLLGSALAFYEKLQGILEAEPGQKARGELAAAYERVGEIHHEIGSRPAAREAFERAQALYERLARDDPAAAEYRAALAETRHAAAKSPPRRASRPRRGQHSRRRGRVYERLARAPRRPAVPARPGRHPHSPRHPARLLDRAHRMRASGSISGPWPSTSGWHVTSPTRRNSRATWPRSSETSAGS